MAARWPCGRCSASRGRAVGCHGLPQPRPPVPLRLHRSGQGRYGDDGPKPVARTHRGAARQGGGGASRRRRGGRLRLLRRRDSLLGTPVRDAARTLPSADAPSARSPSGPRAPASGRASPPAPRPPPTPPSAPPPDADATASAHRAGPSSPAHPNDAGPGSAPPPRCPVSTISRYTPYPHAPAS